jgi:hypothetical protein
MEFAATKARYAAMTVRSAMTIAESPTIYSSFADLQSPQFKARITTELSRVVKQS